MNKCPQSTTGLAEWKVPEYINNDEIHAHQGQHNLPGFVILLLLLQNIDRIDL